jgi:hypothetical protein
MRSRLVVLLCWSVMVGNLLIAATAPTLIIRSHGDPLGFAIQMCITNVLSFGCALILKARILRERTKGLGVPVQGHLRTKEAENRTLPNDDERAR